MEALSGSLAETLEERLEIDLECIPWGQARLIYDEYMVTKFYNTYDLRVKGYRTFVQLKRTDVIKKIIQFEEAKGRVQKKNWKI